MYIDEFVQIDGVNYQVVGLIGQGASASVYVVRSQGLKFALKVVREYNNPIIRQMVKKQIQTQMQFRGNPTIIRIAGFKQTPKRMYILFELGTCSLRSRMMQHTYMDPKQYTDLLLDVTQGLLAVHQKQIIHRDIKPQNIICVQKTYKITDFGCGQSGTIGAQLQIGTPLYWPPEILFGAADYDHRVDVWSLGVTMFQVYFQIHPFYYESRDKDVSSDQVIRQLKYNIQRLTDPQFTIQRFLLHLSRLDKRDVIKSIQNKLLVTPPELVLSFTQFFKHPRHRQDIGYFVAIYKSLQEEIKNNKAQKVGLVVKEEQLPTDIRFYVDTINMINQLCLRYGTPEKDEIIFHLQLGLWYWNFYNYQGSQLICYKNYQRLKDYRKPKQTLWSQVQTFLLNYWCTLCSDKELTFFPKIPVLKIRILMCGARYRINQSTTRFLKTVSEQVNMQVGNLDQLQNLLQVFEMSQLKAIEDVLTSSFYYA